MLRLADRWIWDFWLARDRATWHAFFLQADRSLGDPNRRHWQVSLGHAVSEDLARWSYRGTCFGPASTPAWDDYTTWTGSVVAGDDGRWHLFYTGTCRAERGLKQRIGHAVSHDLHHWQRLGDGLALDLDPRWYEEFLPGPWHDRALRDPWVMRDPEGTGWVMAFTARVPGPTDPNAGGAIGLARSPDLITWTAEPPLFVGGFGQLEVPQIVAFDGRWVCLFCTSARYWAGDAAEWLGQPPVTGTHYLWADRFAGPWHLAAGPFLDGSDPPRRYAGKIVRSDAGPVYLAFEHTAADGTFIGALADPIPVKMGGDGRLSLIDGAAGCCQPPV